MLATDRCFWTLSLVWLRMFLLGDEPLFFLLSLSSSVDAGDGYIKASEMVPLEAREFQAAFGRLTSWR